MARSTALYHKVVSIPSLKESKSPVQRHSISRFPKDLSGQTHEPRCRTQSSLCLASATTDYCDRGDGTFRRACTRTTHELQSEFRTAVATIMASVSTWEASHSSRWTSAPRTHSQKGFRIHRLTHTFSGHCRLTTKDKGTLCLSTSFPPEIPENVIVPSQRVHETIEEDIRRISGLNFIQLGRWLSIALNRNDVFLTLLLRSIACK